MVKAQAMQAANARTLVDVLAYSDGITVFAGQIDRDPGK